MKSYRVMYVVDVAESDRCSRWRGFEGRSRSAGLSFFAGVKDLHSMHSDQCDQ